MSFSGGDRSSGQRSFWYEDTRALGGWSSGRLGEKRSAWHSGRRRCGQSRNPDPQIPERCDELQLPSRPRRAPALPVVFGWPFVGLVPTDTKALPACPVTTVAVHRAASRLFRILVLPPRPDPFGFSSLACSTACRGIAGIARRVRARIHPGSSSCLPVANRNPRARCSRLERDTYAKERAAIKRMGGEKRGVVTRFTSQGRESWRTDSPTLN